MNRYQPPFTINKDVYKRQHQRQCQDTDADEDPVHPVLIAASELF